MDSEEAKVKRTQKNYTPSLKLAMVGSVEKGNMTYI